MNESRLRRIGRRLAASLFSPQAPPQIKSPRELRSVLLPTGEVYPGNYPLLDRAEPNADIMGARWWGSVTQPGVADLMALYPHVAAVMAGLTLPIAQAKAVVLPADERNPRAVEWADVLQAHLTSNDRIGRWLSGAFDYLSRGFYPHYVTWETRAGRELPVHLEPLSPRMHRSVEFDAEGLAWWNFYTPRGVSHKLAVKDLLWLRHGPQSIGRATGEAFTRPMWAPWYRAIEYLNYEAIQAEHLSGGTFVGLLPKDMPVSESDSETLRDKLSAIRASESGAIVLPPGYEIKTLDIGGAAYDIDRAIRRTNQDIYVGGLGQVLVLGLNSEGSRAVGIEHRRIMGAGIAAIAREWTAQFSEHVLRRAVLYTEGERWVEDLTPTLTLEGLSPDLVIETIQAMANAITTGLITVDDEVEKMARRLLDIPQRPATMPTERPAPVKPAASLTMHPAGPPPLPETLAVERALAARRVGAGASQAARRRLSAADMERAHAVADYAAAEFILDTHAAGGEKKLSEATASGRANRAVELYRAVQAGRKARIVLTELERAQLRSAIDDLTDDGLGLGFREQQKEIELQRRGGRVEKIIEEREEQVAEKQAALFPVLSAAYKKDRRKKAKDALTARQVVLAEAALKRDFAALSAAMIRQGRIKPWTEEMVIERASAREAVIWAAQAAQIGAEAFAAGRTDFVVQFKDENPQAVIEFVRSAILDKNLCEVCEEQSGWAFDDPDDAPVPVEDCESTKGPGNRCRCMNLAILRNG